MHLASEVSSTTNSVQEKNNNNNTSTTPTTNGSSGGTNAPLTAETLAERTIDSLLAEHPGELVKTGSPHVVNLHFSFLFFFVSFSTTPTSF